jgi:hypothetical protein
MGGKCDYYRHALYATPGECTTQIYQTSSDVVSFIVLCNQSNWILLGYNGASCQSEMLYSVSGTSASDCNFSSENPFNSPISVDCAQTGFNVQRIINCGLQENKTYTIGNGQCMNLLSATVSEKYTCSSAISGASVTTHVYSDDFCTNSTGNPSFSTSNVCYLTDINYDNVAVDCTNSQSVTSLHPFEPQGNYGHFVNPGSIIALGFWALLYVIIDQ